MTEKTPKVREETLTREGASGKRAVFVDRDDTIAKDVPYCSRPEDLRLFDGVPGSIARLNRAGYMVIVITNQSGIARGRFTEDTLAAIHRKMIADVESGGGRIDDIFYCPHHPDERCGCRKPATGMGVDAVAKHKIDAAASFMVGNSDADVEFGMALGCTSIKVSEEYTFNDAVDDILKE